jgi:transposase InsO family protein
MNLIPFFSLNWSNCLRYCRRWLAWLRHFLAPARPRPVRRRRGKPSSHHTAARFRPAPHRRKGGRPKPPWVIAAVAALHPECGSARKTAATFNRLYAHTGMTVSKSVVQQWLHRHTVEAQAVRRFTRNRLPHWMQPNRCWALDCTGKQDRLGHQHVILGIIDHGTRRVLKLVALETADTQAILDQLFDAIATFGPPWMIRTDNGSVFASDAFRSALAAAGIRHKRSEIAKPWQNGRIERLFLTLKEKLNRVIPTDGAALNRLLDAFLFWYNAVRPHQHLFGLTPMEAWRGIDPYTRAPESAQHFVEWDGLLRGVLIAY